MASSSKSSSFLPVRPSSMQIPFHICLLLIFLLVLLSVLTVKPHKYPPPKFIHRPLHHHREQEITEPPAWFDAIAKHLKTDRVKVGLVNIDQKLDASLLQHLPPRVDTVPVNFDRVDDNLKWKDFFPEWIDEEQKRGPPECPRMPMPEPRRDLNVVVARIPCGGTSKERVSSRDVYRLQVNLVAANLAVESGWLKNDSHRTAFVVFIGRCSPMIEIFRCDDLVTHEDEYWVYKPQLWRLKQLTMMPPGSCQIASNFAETGKELWRAYMKNHNNNATTTRSPRVAYATVLHSSEAYVCGAIALAQSILQTLKHHPLKSHTDLILLADNSIGPKSTRGLEAAGWKIRRIKRILSPFARKNSYNRWNYSKLQLWKLTEYDRVIFIDSDLLVLRNIHDFSFYPQLSAAPNDFSLFNSGLMVIEPSECMLNDMMEKRFSVKSYNGGDQGFLNEIFPWWHRLPSKLNYLKFHERYAEKETELEGVYAIHYLGLKPWLCYRDYDCNWDLKDHQKFASDLAHRKWWQVYKKMPKELQSYCGLTKKMDQRLMTWRSRARNASLAGGRWRIKIKDPRKKHYIL